MGGCDTYTRFLLHMLPTSRNSVLLPATWSALWNHAETVDILQRQMAGLAPQKFVGQGLRPVKPFWMDLPYVDIFLCFTPDIHHQLHKGVFKDHLVNWATSAMDGGAGELDCRFKTMPKHPTLRHFKKGISTITQWTGNEYKNMEKIFTGIVACAASERVLRCVRAVLDFINFARLETHNERTERISIYRKSMRWHITCLQSDHTDLLTDTIRSRQNACILSLQSWPIERRTNEITQSRWQGGWVGTMLCTGMKHI